MAFQSALQYNPQSAEVSRKIKRVSQLVKDKKRAQEVDKKRTNINMTKHLDKLKSELVSCIHVTDAHFQSISCKYLLVYEAIKFPRFHVFRGGFADK